MPPRLMPANRGTDAHTEALRRLVSRGSLVDRFNHTHPQICRIWLGHGAFQKPNRPPRLGLSEPLGNPDSIPTETALVQRATIQCDSGASVDAHPHNHSRHSAMSPGCPKTPVILSATGTGG